jgi:putative membrane protein
MRSTRVALVALVAAPSLAFGALAVRSLAAAPATTATALPSPALDDATIVAIFDAANTADIETGQLAVQRGHSQEVKDYGAMLVRDHTNVRQMGRDLAKKLGVTPTPPRDDQGARDHAAAMAKLRGLQGEAFDHAFLQHEVAFHKGVIDAVNSTLMPAIKNAELKDLVAKIAPAFEAHMIAAANLDKKLGGSTR